MKYTKLELPTTGTCWSKQGLDCEITIEARPSYCDRGSYVAKLFPRGGLAQEIDEYDGWPRYYFVFGNAIQECDFWLM